MAIGESHRGLTCDRWSPNGSRYKENNVGARIDPCGTPQERCAAEEVCFPMYTENFLLFKKD